MSKVDRVMQGMVEVTVERLGLLGGLRQPDDATHQLRSSHSKLTPEQRAKRRAKNKSAKRARKA